MTPKRRPNRGAGRPIGERHGMSVLSEDSVRQIRHRHARGDRQKDLAGEYEVTECTVRNVVHQRTWRHVG